MCRCELRSNSKTRITKEAEENGIANLVFAFSFLLGVLIYQQQQLSLLTSSHSSWSSSAFQGLVTSLQFCSLDFMILKGKVLNLVSCVLLTSTANKDNLPELTATQKNKLKHLTIVSLASRMKVKYTVHDSSCLCF